MKPSAVVLIFHHSSQMRWYERISLAQTSRVLNKHPIHLVCPDGTDTAPFLEVAPNLTFEFVPRGWMSSLRRYNRMKILPDLYRRFADHQFMLTCELDTFVFRDELETWCERGFDYIGAPWISGVDSNNVPIFEPGGNSGFSLRNIQAALRMMHEFHIVETPIAVAKRTYRQQASLLRAMRDFAQVSVGGNSHWAFNFYPKNEDRFWSCLGQTVEWFKIADSSAAVAFSFETFPAALYELNNQQLPFGCHAWQKYDLDFWRPHVESFGYVIPS